MANIPTVKLSNGFTTPAIGFGTYRLRGEEGKEAIREAIDLGYRHLDTACLYENEKEVGEVIQEKISEGKITREDLFVVTKVWSKYHRNVEEACRKSLELLGLSYIDLYLIHFPVAYFERDASVMWPADDEEVDNLDYLEVYSDMEKLVEKGLVRSLGVCSFNIEQIDRLIKNCKIKPVLNEIECHPGLTPSKTIEFCLKNDIVISGFCPLGRYNPEKKEPKYFHDEKVEAIAKKYGKTTFQVVLRYSIEMGVIPLPRSAVKSEIKENIEVFDFQLTKEEIEHLKSYSDAKNRVCCFPFAKKADHYPFNIEF